MRDTDVNYTYTEEDIRKYSEEHSMYVVERFFKSGRSEDIKREATEEERRLVFLAIAGALSAIRSGYDKRSVASTAEYFLIWSNPAPANETHINSYDTVYNPVLDFLENNQSAVKRETR